MYVSWVTGIIDQTQNPIFFPKLHPEIYNSTPSGFV